MAIIIGGFLACWTPYINHHNHNKQHQSSSSSSSVAAAAAVMRRFHPGWTPYTITTIISVTTGQNHNYSVNFAVVFLAFASGLVFISNSLVLVAKFCGGNARRLF